MNENQLPTDLFLTGKLSPPSPFGITVTSSSTGNVSTKKESGKQNGQVDRTRAAYKMAGNETNGSK